MDVMAANALLRAVIEASRELDVNAEKIPVWQAMLDKMPPYELNEKGELREWMWGGLEDNHKHRHASHLFGLYDLHDPQIMQSEALIEGCKRVIDRRMEIRRQDNGGIMAFGMVQLAFNAAALGDLESAYRIKLERTGSTTTFLSKTNQTVKLKLKGNQIKEVNLTAGEPVQLSF